MMGRCYPVATNLNEIANIGGYLNTSGGTALKNLYTTPTRVLDMAHQNYTLSLTQQQDSKSQTLSNYTENEVNTGYSYGGTPSGQINVYTSSTGSGGYDFCNNWLNYCWSTSTKVTVKRDREGISGTAYGNHTDMKITLTEIYY